MEEETGTIAVLRIYILIALLVATLMRVRGIVMVMGRRVGVVDEILLPPVVR